MKFVSVQPDSTYFIWQLQVQINNFRKFGIEKDAIILIAFDPKVGINSAAKDLKKSTIATVIFYPDDREDKKYPPSIQPRILKHFAVRFEKEIRCEQIFYHDSDMIFRKFPDFKSMNKTDVAYLSDTISYIGAEYIKSKGESTFKKMCNIVGIDPKVVEDNQLLSGGAQHLFPPTDKMDKKFWEKVENDSNILFKYMKTTEKQYLKTTTTHKDGKTKDYPIQSWTAGMWSLLWNLWLIGIKTEISDQISFSWPTNKMDDLNRHNILHNAGVEATHTHLFYKGAYVDKTPFEENFDYVDREYCSWFYVQEIMDTAKSINGKYL
jgi:hypothetical protein